MSAPHYTYYICSHCGQTIGPGQFHICPWPSGTLYVCSCGQTVGHGKYHICPIAPQSLEAENRELKLKLRVMELERENEQLKVLLAGNELKRT